MEIALVYPPFLVDNEAFPPLSLPSLAAALRRDGHRVQPIDLNIEFYRRLMSAGGCGDLQERIGQLAQDCVENGGPPTGFYSLRRFCELWDARCVWMPFIRRELEKARHRAMALQPEVRRAVLERLTSSALLEAGCSGEVLEWTTAQIVERLNANRGSLLWKYINESLIPRLLERQTRLVGISLMTEQQLYCGLAVAKAVKEMDPETHVVLGGGLVSAVAEKVVASDGSLFEFVDECVTFDGEDALSSLVKSVEDRRPVGAVPNVIWRDGDTGRICYMPPRETGSLDNLETPDFQGLNMRTYSRSVLPYYMTKGCSFGRCTYCSDPAYSSARNKSPRRAADEIEMLLEQHEASTILFVDSYIHPALLEGLARELVARGLRVGWLTQTRMDRFLTTERLELFAQSGCRELWFGMETVNERLTRLIRKGTKEVIIRRILGDCERLGIKVTLNVMIGFPGETEEEALETQRFVGDLPKAYPNLKFKCNTGFVYVPRLSAFGQNPEAYGIEVLEEFEWSPRLEWIPPAWRRKAEFSGKGTPVSRRFYGGEGKERAARRAGHETRRRVRRREHVYIHDLTFDPKSAWRTACRNAERVDAIQRAAKCGKMAAVAQIEGERASPPKERGAVSWAYVVAGNWTSRLVRVDSVLGRVLAQVGEGREVGELKTRMRRIYGGSPGDEVDRATRESLQFLEGAEVVEFY